MTPEDLWNELLTDVDTLTIATLECDEEYFTISFVEAQCIRLGRHYLTHLEIPESDSNPNHCALLSSPAEIEGWLKSIGSEFVDVDGCTFEVCSDLASRATRMPDSLSLVAQLLDQYWEQSIGTSESRVMDPIPPSLILTQLFSQQPLKSTANQGFVIDAAGEVLISSGIVLPFWGKPAHFTEALGDILSALNIR